MTAVDRLELLRDTLAAYNRLRDKAIAETGTHEQEAAREEWPELVLVAVAACPGPSLTWERAWAQLNDCAAAVGAQGWVRYRSRWAVFGSGKGALPAVGDGETGPPIAAEWSEGAGASAQLRPCPEYGQPSGSLALWRYAERALDPGETLTGHEIPALRQRIWVLEHPVRHGRPRARTLIPCLVYHVFWSADEADPSALRRLFARFTGFEQRADRYREPPRRSRHREG
ncbi:MAG: hypothetical protein ACREFK_01100 [Stellaceae bacterium]